MSRTTRQVKTDPRYRSARWKQLRLVILARDGYRCWVETCDRKGDVCDHIEPVYEGMPDSQFYDPANLRASCRRHNLVRGYVAKLERDMAGGVRPAPRRCSYGGTREIGGSLGMASPHDSALPKSLSPERFPTVTRDYSRKLADDGAA